jgi:glycerophosphoryl diester phosphodiesterase
LTLATKLGCVALVLHESAWTAMRIAQTQAQTLRAWCYTVNAPRRAHQLLAWGIDGLITDEVARFNPSSSDG